MTPIGIAIALTAAGTVALGAWGLWTEEQARQRRHAWQIRHMDCGPHTANRDPSGRYLELDYCGPWCRFDPIKLEP